MANILRMTNTHINLLCWVFSWRPCLRTNWKAETQWSQSILLKSLSANKAAHENTHFPGGLFNWILMVKFIKRALRILKKTIPSPRKSKNIFLITKPLNPGCFWQKTVFLFCFFILHPGLSWLISKWLDVVNYFAIFCLFSQCFGFVFYLSHVFLPLWLDYCKV